MNANQNNVQELKSSWVQEPLAISEPAEGPLVIELKSSWVQTPGEVAEAAPADGPSALRMAVNQKKRVVIDVWWLGVGITLDEPSNLTAQPGNRPAEAA
jgi:hypothetical protein